MTWNKRKSTLAAIVFSLAVMILGSWSGVAAAEKKSVAEKLLDVLKANHQISDEQYDELMKEAQAEKAERAEMAAQVAKAARAADVAQMEIAAQAARETKAEKTAAATPKEKPPERSAVQGAREPKTEPVAAAPAKEKNPLTFDASWKNGLNLKTADDNFNLHVGGVVQVDFASISADAQMKKLADKAGQPIEGYGDAFRRARITIEGGLYQNIEFKTEFDFARANVTFTDVWLGVKDIPYLGRIRAGHMKEPFSLEELTGNAYLTFMERSLPVAFTEFPSNRATGAQVLNSILDNRMTWAAGGFMAQTDSAGDSFANTPNVDIAARLTGLPWYEENGRELLHLGAGYVHKFRNPDNKIGTQVRFRSRSEEYVVNLNTVDTLSIPSDGADLYNAELALVYGPFSLQGEYFHTFVNADKFNNPQFNGYYAYVSYFITGEYRNYDTSMGVFTRVSPNRNFNLANGGWGAWEVAVRYSNLNLNDALVAGGEENNVSAGLNWYLNPNVRTMFNYVHTNVSDRKTTQTVTDANADVFESRLQLNF